MFTPTGGNILLIVNLINPGRVWDAAILGEIESLKKS